MNNYPMIAARVFNTPLLAEPSKLQVIQHVIAARMGVDLPMPEAAQLNDEERSRAGYRVEGSVAIIPVIGTLVGRGDWVDALSGIVSYQRLQGALSKALDDDAVKSILFEYSTGGGEVELIQALAADIVAARDVKPVVSIVNEHAFSAGYWLASAGGEVIVTPGGTVGSIGVVWTHFSMEKAAEQQGVAVTHIHAGAKKVQWSQFKGLTDEAKADMQNMIDSAYDAFVGAVASNRGISAEDVRKTEAGIYTAEDALKIGLVDRIAPFAQVLSEMQAGTPSALNRGKAVMAEKITTVAQLRESYPQLVGQIDEANKLAMTGAKEAAATAVAEAGEAERTRIQSILDHDEAKGREAQARALAFTQSMTAEAAAPILAAAPKVEAAKPKPKAETEFSEYMEAHDPNVAPNEADEPDNAAANAKAAAAGWDMAYEEVARVN